MKTLFALLAVLAAVPAHAGVATSGGVPDIELLSCGDSAYGSSRIGDETTGINLTVSDARVTDAPFTTRVAFELVAGKVRFFAEGVELRLATEPGSNGAFQGRLTHAAQTVDVACTFLAENFRPLAAETLSLKVRHGGKKCFAGGQCVGYVGGLIPQEAALHLEFDPATASLRGVWTEENTVFDESIVTTLRVTKKRGEAHQLALELGPKGAREATNVTLSGDRVDGLRLMTPALSIADDASLSVWQELSAQPAP